MTESGLRKKLRKQGYILRKSKKRDFSYLDPNDMGGYRIVDLYHNFVVAGVNFDLSLEDVEQWANEPEDDNPAEKTD